MADRLCDLHCDTLYEIRKRKTSLLNHDGHLSIKKLSRYKSFIQVMAMWSDKRLSCDEAYDAFLDASALLDREVLAACEDGYKLEKVTKGSQIEENEKKGVSSLIFAVEGGSLLDTRISRLEVLRENGVRILTLVWAGNCPIGGAHDTSEGLTEFGRQAVRECFNIGIIPDVSHASDKMIYEVLDLAAGFGKPVIASHSNSRAVYSHTRNLTDEFYREIVRLGGVTGISFAPEHISQSDADIGKLLAHICHYSEIDRHGVCLGCDFDVVTSLPEGVESCADLVNLETAVSDCKDFRGSADDLFYNNARNFLVSNL